MKTIILALFTTPLLLQSTPDSDSAGTLVAENVEPNQANSWENYGIPKPEAPPEIAALLEVKESASSIISELERTKADDWVETLSSSKEDMVHFQESNPSLAIANDSFNHRIYYKLSTDEYWVVRTGGYFQVYQIYGPGKLDDN